MSSFNYLYNTENLELLECLKTTTRQIRNTWLSLLRLETYSKTELSLLHRYNDLFFESKNLYYQIHLCKSNKSFIIVREKLQALENKLTALMMDLYIYYKNVEKLNV
jgi:hypothetical protein